LGLRLRLLDTRGTGKHSTKFFIDALLVGQKATWLGAQWLWK